MSRGGEHHVVIRRRGRSHRAWCPCGWSGHAWNDLRPAEADAWEHIYGSERIVDTSAIPGPGEEVAAAGGALDLDELSGRQPAPSRRGPAPEVLVRRAIELAGSPSPYGRQGPTELWNLSERDRTVVEGAVSEIGELLADHSRRSAGTADREWLELITAKRLLEECLREAGVGSSAL